MKCAKSQAALFLAMLAGATDEGLVLLVQMDNERYNLAARRSHIELRGDNALPAPAAYGFQQPTLPNIPGSWWRADSKCSRMVMGAASRPPKRCASGGAKRRKAQTDAKGQSHTGVRGPRSWVRG